VRQAFTICTLTAIKLGIRMKPPCEDSEMCIKAAVHASSGTHQQQEKQQHISPPATAPSQTIQFVTARTVTMLFNNVLIALLSSASLAVGLAFPGGDGDGDGDGEYHGDKGKTCSAIYSTKYIPGETKSQYYETKTNEYPYPTEVTTAYTTSSAYPYPTTVYNTTARATPIS
jgi:hypothetical protein